MQRRTGDKISIRGDYQYRALYKGWIPQRFWHYAKFSEAVKYLDPRPRETILDIGCGSGVLANLLAEDAEVNVIGIDNNLDALSFCQETYNKPNLEFRYSLADELDFRKESVDKIALLEMIEHIYREQALIMLRSFHEILRPSGRLLITTPNLKSLWPFQEWIMDKTGITAQMADDQHVITYDAESLSSLTEEAGFKTIDIRAINFLAPWVAIFGWKFGQWVHNFEQKFPHGLGSVLLGIFEKL